MSIYFHTEKFESKSHLDLDKKLTNLYNDGWQPVWIKEESKNVFLIKFKINNK